jgi:hypothetical protein
MDRQGDALQRTLDHDFRNTAFLNTGVYVFPDFLVLNQLLGKPFTTEPTGVPAADDP